MPSRYAVLEQEFTDLVKGLVFAITTQSEPHNREVADKYSNIARMAAGRGLVHEALRLASFNAAGLTPIDPPDQLLERISRDILSFVRQGDAEDRSFVLLSLEALTAVSKHSQLNPATAEALSHTWLQMAEKLSQFDNSQFILQKQLRLASISANDALREVARRHKPRLLTTAHPA